MTMSVQERNSGSGGKEEESEDESEILEESPCGRWQKRKEQTSYRSAHQLCLVACLSTSFLTPLTFDFEGSLVSCEFKHRPQGNKGVKISIDRCTWNLEGELENCSHILDWDCSQWGQEWGSVPQGPEQPPPFAVLDSAKGSAAERGPPGLRIACG
ncbi:hypothetical protein JZ751_003766, partial [Albula glossodonta]